ncbi:MAG: preprotein translocase subunit YajC [Firmicutes bacterium]|nr:preprotein translocase subunit YajC [Bacillota bacterium]
MHTAHTTSPVYWLFFLVLIGMMVWMFVQQSRQQKKRQQLQSSLTPGEMVVTLGGIIGKVVSVDASRITLELAENVRVRFLRTSIGSKYEDS